jgi:hypothetical protein
MTSAVFGLVGVIVGALLSGIIQYAIQKRKERMAARVAARLIRDDWYLAACRLEDAIAAGRWMADPRDRIDTTCWQEQRIHLATAMPYPEYASVGSALYAVTRINDWLNAGSPDRAISREDEGRLQQLLADLSAGLAVLKKHAA